MTRTRHRLSFPPAFRVINLLRLWAEYNECLLRIADAESHDVFWFDFDMPAKQLRDTVVNLVKRLGLRAGNVDFNPFLRHHAAAHDSLEPRIQELYERLRARAQCQTPVAPAVIGQAEKAADVRPKIANAQAELEEQLAHLVRVQSRYNEMLQWFQRSLTEIQTQVVGVIAPETQDLRARLDKLEKRVFLNLLIRWFRKLTNTLPSCVQNIMPASFRRRPHPG